MKLDWNQVKKIVELALAEDLGSGDLTTQLVVSENLKATGVIIAKGEGVLAGLEVTGLVFNKVNINIEFLPRCADGDRVDPGAILAEVIGPARGILAGERVALNFLQRLSGIATLTARFVAAVAGTGVQITDTRKTTPGLRLLEKYAVRVGGGQNHRFGLYDGVLIKENHIAAAGDLTTAVRRAKGFRPNLPVEVEARDLAEVEEAFSAGADRIMLDNMDIEQMEQAVRLIRRWSAHQNRQVKIEASGGITLENVRQVAQTGVDYISIGALTHSAPALDLSLLLQEVPVP